MYIGPDSQQTQTITYNNIVLQFYSTVLHLRGRNNVPQPVCENNNILCWNGEIFDGLSVSVLLFFCINNYKEESFSTLNNTKSGICHICYKISLEENDTSALMDHLTKIDPKDPAELLDIFSQIEGPFAFVFYQVKNDIYHNCNYMFTF